MYSQTKAIVLHKTNYSETSLVVQVFTQEYGKLGLLIQGAKKRKSRTKTALFEPLTILNILGNFSDTNKLIRPSEVKLQVPFISIQSSITKRTLALFLSEMIHKSLALPHPDPSTFAFIESSLIYLEETKQNVSNFHLIFLTQLSKHLGFHPQVTTGNYFDLLEGVFTNSIPQNSNYLSGPEKDLFLSILGINIDESTTLNISSSERKSILSSIIKYYQTHITTLGDIKSHLVLETIFI